MSVECVQAAHHADTNLAQRNDSGCKLDVGCCMHVHEEACLRGDVHTLQIVQAQRNGSRLNGSGSKLDTKDCACTCGGRKCKGVQNLCADVWRSRHERVQGMKVYRGGHGPRLLTRCLTQMIVTA
eukprot:1149603-Pelagomonas_calceolata.AAC.7